MSLPRPARAFAIAALTSTALLAGCGGGGGGAPSAPGAVAPLIAQSPASRAVAAGSTVSFEVAAVGTTPFRYQWLRDGRPIPGATGARYTTPTLTQADSDARFSVVVSNAAGEAVSREATLTVFAPPAPAESCTGAEPFSVVADDTVAVNRVAGAVLAGCGIALREVRWTQTGGVPVALRSASSPAISFEPPEPGTYGFRAQFTDGSGAARTHDLAVTVTGAAPARRIVARVDQAVREGQRASVRAWPTLPDGDAPAQITWSQISGPAVALDTSDPTRILFTAPAVARDTVLRFRVTMRTLQGAVDSDDVRVVVEDLPAPPAGQLFDDPPASRVHPYRATSPFAAVLARCTFDPALFFNNGTTNLCTLGTLPLLAQTAGGATPTVEQVMDRVLVSHDWMGERFEQFLRAQAHDDFLRLFGSVTAIVIGAHVRPSFYWSATGAIYLDADNLWLEPAERDVISEVPDARSGFDRELAYTGPWRYVVNNAPALRFWDPALRQTRGLDVLDYELGSLLYHELAHANDFLPPATRLSVSPTLLVFESGRGFVPSERLARALPLASDEMFGLARVKFFGVPANAVQKSWTPQQVAEFFRADRATDEYNYALPAGEVTPREDVAMLFEEFMMSRRYNARRDVGFTNKLLPGMTGSDLIVAWGERGRIALPSIRPRIRLVLQEIAPWMEAEIDALPATVALREGASWTANLNPSAPVSPAAARGPVAGEDARSLERLLRLRAGRAQPRTLPR